MTNVETLAPQRALKPEEMLQLALLEVQNGSIPCTKALTILLDDSRGYTFTYYNAGLTIIEMIALLDNLKLALQQEIVGEPR